MTGMGGDVAPSHPQPNLPATYVNEDIIKGLRQTHTTSSGGGGSGKNNRNASIVFLMYSSLISELSIVVTSFSVR